MRTLKAVGPGGATRQTLADLVKTSEFVDLINHGLVANRLVGSRDTETPAGGSDNSWYLTEAGANLVNAAGR